MPNSGEKQCFSNDFDSRLSMTTSNQLSQRISPFPTVTNFSRRPQLSETDQAFEQPKFKKMIDVAAHATHGVNIPSHYQTRQAIIAMFKAQMKALKDRLNVCRGPAIGSEQDFKSLSYCGTYVLSKLLQGLAHASVSVWSPCLRKLCKVILRVMRVDNKWIHLNRFVDNGGARLV